MTIVAVMAEPPIEGVLSDLNGPLSAADTVSLYEAMLGDICEAIQNGAGELLVNYRERSGVNSQTQLETALTDELPRPEDVRYEVQVGENFANRAGNTTTHLIESEGVDSVVIVKPTAAFLSRETLGTVMMKLRTHEVVVGPSTGGRTYLAGFRNTINFEDIFAPPSLQTLVNRARDADLAVDFAPMLPVIEGSHDLVTAVSHIRARVRAGRNVPPRTAEFVANRGLEVIKKEDELAVIAK